MEYTRSQPVGIIRGGHGDQVDHENAGVPCGRHENNQCARSHGIRVVLNSRRRLAFAGEEQISSATTLRLVDWEGLHRDNTMGPLNTRSLTDVRRQVRERATPSREGKILV